MVIVEVNPYKSVGVLQGEKSVRIDTGDVIQFATETGETIKGRVTKISGKGEKTKFQIIPIGEQKEEIWSVVVMQEASLEVIEDEEA